MRRRMLASRRLERIHVMVQDGSAVRKAAAARACTCTQPRGGYRMHVRAGLAPPASSSGALAACCARCGSAADAFHGYAGVDAPVQCSPSRGLWQPCGQRGKVAAAVHIPAPPHTAPLRHRCWKSAGPWRRCWAAGWRLCRAAAAPRWRTRRVGRRPACVASPPAGAGIRRAAAPLRGGRAARTHISFCSCGPPQFGGWHAC